MKTTPAPPSHVRLDDQFGIEKFESFLKSNDPKESKAVFAGKSNAAVMLLHRLPTQSDSKLARLQKQLNEEANSERMTDKNTREKVNFPKFSALADKYNAELSLTSAIETQIFKSA